MCIIVSKEKGIEMPDREVLERCFDNNPDGAGFMYTKNGKVQIRKGFMTFEDFWNNINKLERVCGNLKDIPLVMHFRISTAGNVDKGNCHPYPVIDNDRALRSLTYSCELGMAHNGIIDGYEDENKLLNDTQMFIKEVVSVFCHYDKKFLENMKVVNILEDIAGSKLCFLDNDENITYIGDFIEEDGVKYSNSTYLERYYYPLYPDYYSYYYEDGSDYYDDYYDLLEQVQLGKELTDNEFFIVCDHLNFLESYEYILFKNDDLIEVGGQEYAIDDFNNLYLLDYENNVIKFVDSDVEVLTKEEINNRFS